MRHIHVPTTLFIALTAALAWGGFQASAVAQPATQAIPAAAQQLTAQPAPAPPGVAVAPTTVLIPEDRSALETRERLVRLLEMYPPTLARVFKLDPTLMANPAYLAPYPSLAAFLSQHPEIAHNARYFLESIPGGDYYVTRTPTRDEAVMTMWENLMAGTAILLVILAIVSTLIWLVRTLLDHRRWLRLSKIQVEVHTKLFDRLTANEDLLAYIQTPAGRRFLEAAPIAMEPADSALGSPARRVLWAVQAGLVLAAGGIGLLVVSWRTPPEVAQAISVIGVLALALGIGFVLSAGVSLLLSKRLGLFERPAAAGGGQAPLEGA